MKLFEKSLKGVAVLDSVMTTANATFKEEQKKAMETYRDPLPHIGKLRAVLIETEETQKNIFRETVKKEFAEARNKVNAVVTAGAPSDFPATLEAIKASGKDISEYEASAFLEKYKGNYLAFRTLAEVLHRMDRAKNVRVIYPDAIMYQINDCEAQLLNWCLTYKGSSILTGLLLSDSNPVTALEALVQDFIDGRYTQEKEEE